MNVVFFNLSLFLKSFMNFMVLLQENYLSAIKTFSGPLEDIKLCELNHNDHNYHSIIIKKKLLKKPKKAPSIIS